MIRREPDRAISRNTQSVATLRRLASIAAAMVCALAASPAWPQSTQRVVLTVPPSISAAPAAKTVLAISVGPANAVPRNSFVRVRGLPPMAALSDGHSIAPGSWAIPIAALPDLTITLPTGAAGKSDVSVTLVSIDGSVLASARTTLVIAAEQTQAGPAARPPPAGAKMLRAGAPVPGPLSTPATTAPAPKPAISDAAHERGLRLMEKGDQQLNEGNISAARLFYERAADEGLAKGAMALAGTYDASELAQLKVRGVPPDPAQARHWYERARQLGATDADLRLQRLGAN
jgi:hypothetical protein